MLHNLKKDFFFHQNHQQQNACQPKEPLKISLLEINWVFWLWKPMDIEFLPVKKRNKKEDVEYYRQNWLSDLYIKGQINNKNLSAVINILEEEISIG